MEKIKAVQKDMESIVQSIEVKLIRPRQKEAFLCNARCCDSAGSHDELDSCIKGCSMKVQQIEKMVNAELSEFQSKLQRCAQRCQESAQDGLYANGGNPDQRDVERAQAGMEKCVGGCSDQFKGTLPKIKDRIFSQCS
mmetsp:Transcript_35970/g.49935  ORF Transcript_35970/g.49935 Transcript_35970/m.49935 type:complete len:138 (-) Transcript_35970:274-687(-)